MALSERPQSKCGDCIFFDPRGVDGTPFTTRTGDSGGVCRVNNGLQFGILSPDSSCRQLSGIFQRREVPAPAIATKPTK